MTKNLLKEIEAGNKNGLIKKRIIKYYLYNDSSTIAQLASEMTLSIPTISKFINEMCDDNYLTRFGKQDKDLGRKPTVFGLNPKSGYFIGVDIKRFSISISLINFRGQEMEKKTRIPYDFENTPEALERLCEIIKDFIAKNENYAERLLNICVTISGRVNPESGYSFSRFNFSEIPLAEVLSEKIGYPVCIDNDTRAMTYGELMRGCVNGAKDVIFINISWGLGIGIIIDGKIYTGKSGFSGEFGHVNVLDNEILCHCGKKGCLETEASGSAMQRILLKRLKAGESSILCSNFDNNQTIPNLDDIIDAVNKEDLLCIDIIEGIGQKLGRYIAGLISLFNPELVIIGGVLSTTGDYILQPIKSSIRKYSLNLINKDAKVVLSELGNDAGVVGASMIARSRKFDI